VAFVRISSAPPHPSWIEGSGKEALSYRYTRDKESRKRRERENSGKNEGRDWRKCFTSPF